MPFANLRMSKDINGSYNYKQSNLPPENCCIDFSTIKQMQQHKNQKNMSIQRARKQQYLFNKSPPPRGGKSFPHACTASAKGEQT